MPGLDMPPSSNSNRAFLQAFLSQSTLTYASSRPLLAAIFSASENTDVSPNDITQEDFLSYIAAANTSLSPLDLEIRSAFHQVTRERMYCLVNVEGGDEGIKLATGLGVEEVGFVKRVIDGMFEGNTRRREGYCIAGMDAVRLAKGGSGTGGLSMRDAESCLAGLVEGGWLERSERGFYSLSVRALLELRGWLVDTYNDPEEEGDGEEGGQQKVRFCGACKEIITVGQRCKDLGCGGRLHDICTQNWFRLQKGRVCPVCSGEWEGAGFVGEKAITTSESYLRGKRRSGNVRPAVASSEPGEEGEGGGDED
jgi:hypothetical protein